MPSITVFFILALAVYRISLMLVIEDGPFRLFDRLRAASNEMGVGAGVLSCLWCASVWVSGIALLVLTYGGVVGEIVLTLLGLSGAAVLFSQMRDHADE